MRLQKPLQALRQIINVIGLVLFRQNVTLVENCVINLLNVSVVRMTSNKQFRPLSAPIRLLLRGRPLLFVTSEVSRIM